MPEPNRLPWGQVIAAAFLAAAAATCFLNFFPDSEVAELRQRIERLEGPACDEYDLCMRRRAERCGR